MSSICHLYVIYYVFYMSSICLILCLLYVIYMSYIMYSICHLSVLYYVFYMSSICHLSVLYYVFYMSYICLILCLLKVSMSKLILKCRTLAMLVQVYSHAPYKVYSTDILELFLHYIIFVYQTSIRICTIDVNLAYLYFN